MNFIKTKELIEIVLANSNKWIEARLRFNNISATHFLFFADNKLYDEGIDGEEREVDVNDFINYYQNSNWQLDNII